MNDDLLLRELRCLAEKLQARGIRLILGGGYGLVLKVNHVQRVGAATRLRELPLARSTADLDLFLGAEVITDANQTRLIRQALDALGYAPVESARYYQFYRDAEWAGVRRRLKFDFLAAPVAEDLMPRVRMDKRRIKPRGGSGWHAHTTPEAFTLEEYLLSLNIGTEDAPVTVYLPHPFSYLLLKLFALRDQCRREEKGYGRHHAFDLYLTWGLMTAEETAQAEQLHGKYSQTGKLREALEVAQQLFGDVAGLGLVRLREQVGEPGTIPEAEDFRADVRTLFGPLS